MIDLRLKINYNNTIMPKTNVLKKILFVGDERICRQVAYVLNIKNYEFVETLTVDNDSEFGDYQIFVCQFKNKSINLVDKKLKKKKNIQYLGDICRLIDEEYYRNQQLNKENLCRCCMPWFKYLKLKLRNLLKFFYYHLKGCKTLHNVKRLRYHKITNNNKKYLRCLKPSKLFLYVLNAPVNENVKCSLLENHMLINNEGDVLGCCGSSLYFGNLLKDGNLDYIYNSIYARIIKLSSLNNSYCLCNLSEGCSCITLTLDKVNSNYDTPECPEIIINSIDNTCNLCCKSCRNKPYILDKKAHEKLNIIANKLNDSGYLNNTSTLIVAGHGEVLYSPYYRQLLESGLQRESIRILSNGTLFNETNWNWLKDKYKIIDVEISVDAATEETYKKLRGGNFTKLMDNLRMLGNLRHEGKIRKLIFNFVIQRDNFREMPAFVRLAKKLNVDSINFQHMNNFGNLTKKDFLQKRLIINNEYFVRELYEVLQDQIFQDPIVDLRIIQPYLDASKKFYKKNLLKE